MRLYDNSRTVADEDTILADFQQRSSTVYQNHPHQTLSYGSHPRQNIDVFECGLAQAPVLVFIHGGYWQWCCKEDFGFIVPPLLTTGLDVLLLEYPLTPDVSFEQLVQSVGQGLDFLAQQPHWQNHQVYLCGHSAGGHLSAHWQHHAFVDHIVAISGLYDLQPLVATHLNEALQLSEQDVLQYSPIQHKASHKPLHIAYGLEELDELQWQSSHYAEQLMQQGFHPVVHPMTQTNHYTILDHIFNTTDATLARLLEIDQP